MVIFLGFLAFLFLIGVFLSFDDSDRTSLCVCLALFVSTMIAMITVWALENGYVLQ